MILSFVGTIKQKHCFEKKTEISLLKGVGKKKKGNTGVSLSGRRSMSSAGNSRPSTIFLYYYLHVFRPVYFPDLTLIIFYSQISKSRVQSKYHRSKAVLLLHLPESGILCDRISVTLPLISTSAMEFLFSSQLTQISDQFQCDSMFHQSVSQAFSSVSSQIHLS